MKKVFFVLLGILFLGAAFLGGLYFSGNLGEDDLSSLVSDMEEDGGFSYEFGLNSDELEDELEVSDVIQYYNDKYGYSLEFPEDWLIGYFGDDKENADMVWFVSDEADFQSGNGGLPVGAKVEVIIQDLEMFTEVDSEFPDIETIDDWVAWEEESQPSIEDDFQGEAEVSEIEVAGQEAVKQIYDNPTVDDYGKLTTVKFLDSSGRYVFMLQYLGGNSAYDEFKGLFDEIVDSFSF